MCDDNSTVFGALSPAWMKDCVIVLVLKNVPCSWLLQGCLGEASPTVDVRRLLRPSAVGVYPPKGEALEIQVSSGE